MAEDKRIIHTKERIHHAMLICLDSTSLDKVTVMQICETAGINRSTFYAHYHNPLALYRLMEQSMIDRMNQYFESLKCKSISYSEFLQYFLGYFYENSELFLALYKTDSVSLKKASVDLVVSYGFLSDTISEDKMTYVFEYYVSGVFSVIARWLREDRLKSIDEMAKLLYRLTYTPIHYQKNHIG